MQLNSLNKTIRIDSNEKLRNKYLQFQKLIDELRHKQLDDTVISTINNHISTLNKFTVADREFEKQLRKSQASVLKVLEKKHKLVVKNHYRNMWLALGVGAFGVPLGVAFGAVMGNMAFIGIGMPIGFAIGIGLGIAMDKKAEQNGKQLETELVF